MHKPARHYGARDFRKVDPLSLAEGDVVKANGALWRVDGFQHLKAGTYRDARGNLQTEMVAVTCVDPRNSQTFRVGGTKTLVRFPRDDTWEIDVTERAA